MAASGGSVLRRLLTATDVEMLHSRVAFYYVLVLAWQWTLLAYVWWGVRKTGTSLRTLIGGRWASPWDIAKDVGIGLASWLLFWVGWIVFALLSGLRPETRAEVQALMPATWLGLTLWILVSLSAGFCEEIVFRGYLQKQLLGMTGSVSLAVVGQGLLFGVVHIYQGLTGAIIISVMGILIGMLAAWRKSLRPGMVAHVWQDGFIGIVTFLVRLAHRQ